MLIIGHRGAAGLAPENTLSSLQAAVSAGVDMVEVDLRQTKDKHIVLSHDPALLRTHDDRRKISDLTLEEVREIGKREGREIPELSEFLAAAKLPVNLELKETGMEKIVLEKLKNFPHRVLISSNHPQVLQKIRTLDGNAQLGLIIGPKTGFIFPVMLALASRLKVQSIHPVENLITPAHMRSMRRTGAKVYVWTINDIHQFLVMKGMGVDGIFTDYPNIIK